MPEITRREVLLSGLSAVASVAGMSTVGATQQEEARWDIGLPLQEGWSAQISGTYSPVGVTSDHQLVLVAEAEFSLGNDQLYLIDLETGSKEEIASFSENIFDAAVSDRTILLSLPDEVLALDTKGNELWRDSTAYEEPYFIYAYDHGFLYLGSTVGETSHNGEQVGHYDRGQLVGISTEGDRHFTKDVGFATEFWATEDRIIATVTNQTNIEDRYEITDGYVLCLGLDGTEQWQVNTDPPIRLDTHNSQVIVATTDDTFEVIDISSGERADIYDIGSSIDDFAAGGGRIYYHHDTRFKAIDIGNGSEKWSIDTGGGIYDISFYEGALYTGWDSGRFDMRNPTDGATVWEQSYGSKNDTAGYEWVVYGRLITFYGDTIRCFLGQKAVAMDRYQQLTTPKGMAIGSRLNQLISGGKLTRAEKAIEDGRYQAALRTLDDVKWRLTAINSVLGVTVLGSTYVGSRKSVSSIRRRQFKQKVDQLKSAYPISEGGLEGLTPQEILSQADVALDSQDSGLLGDRLGITLEDETQYERLEATISQYIELAPQLTRLSRKLANLDASDDVRQYWTKEIRSCVDDPDTLANRCETIGELLSRYQSWQEYATPAFEFVDEKLDTNAVPKAFQTAGVTGINDDTVARTYADAATEFVTAAGESEETLSGYNLSAVLDVARRALTTEPSSYEGAASSLVQLAELIRTAAESERTRQSLSLKYTDESKDNIKDQLQEAISSLHLSRVQELDQYIGNLASGTWQLQQLTSLSPTEFEQLVGNFYSVQGYSTQVTRQSDDRGIDVIARGEGEVLAIQAKRYTGSNKVGRPTIQKIVGAGTQVDADRSVVVTTSGFTSAATSAAREFGSRVELINGDALVRLLTKSSLSPPQSSDSRSTNTSSGSTGAERNERQTGQSRQQSRQARCDACGELFRGELTRVTLPDGSAGYCCPRCEQLIDESIGTTEADTQDAAAVLGISPDASSETIEAAYRKRVKECHPDTSGGDREEFLRVQEAYETLTG